MLPVTQPVPGPGAGSAQVAVAAASPRAESGRGSWEPISLFPAVVVGNYSRSGEGWGETEKKITKCNLHS